MTAILERLIAIIAPHTCLVCSSEDNVLCEACLRDVFVPLASVCVFCAKPTVDWRLCAHCQRGHALQAVWVAGEYGGVIAKLLRCFKFERVKAAAAPLAKALDATLPYAPPDTVIVPLPTAARRVRQRGYDQTLLIARELAKLRGLPVATVLERISDSRQVGAKRQQRMQQAKTAYSITRGASIKGRTVLIVDDICTTGASLSATAALLRKTGAKEVSAAVVAWQRPK